MIIWLDIFNGLKKLTWELYDMTCRTVYFLPTGKPAKFGGIEIEYLPQTYIIYCFDVHADLYTFIYVSCAKDL